MTEAQVIEAISARWMNPSTGWPSLQPSVPAVLENVGAQSADKWARLTIRMTTSRQYSMGPAPNRRFERRGRIMIQLFGPTGVGRADLAGLVETVRTLFEAQTLGADLVAYAASTQDVTTDDRWFQVNVTIPFVFYESR
jgi:hypothetical protein